MSWNPSKGESVSIWCNRYKRYVNKSRIDGKCEFTDTTNEHCKYCPIRRGKIKIEG